MAIICSHCGAELHEGSKFCEYCGARVQTVEKPAETREPAADQLVAAGEAGFAIGKAARIARLNADYTGESVLSDRMYNVVLMAVLLWGIVVNMALCASVGDVYRFLSPGALFLIYFVLVIAGTMIAAKSHNPIVSFLGYNLIVVPLGLVVSTVVALYGGVGSRVVYEAFVYTALICLGMLAAAVAFPQLFRKLGGALLGCLLGLVLCEVLLLVFRVEQSATDWLASGIFSLYIGYDVHRSQQFVKTMDNAVDCALDIYLDIANLFLRVLRLMGRRKKD